MFRAVLQGFMCAGTLVTLRSFLDCSREKCFIMCMEHADWLWVLPWFGSSEKLVSFVLECSAGGWTFWLRVYKEVGWVFSPPASREQERRFLLPVSDRTSESSLLLHFDNIRSWLFVVIGLLVWCFRRLVAFLLQQLLMSCFDLLVDYYVREANISMILRW